ncbi:hypothetical protein F5X98DRAFT_386674 [Xylaria grammica]|nr:hypothetical protein F5X98DRAFT_386674 [Xylaria grammica]
MAMNAPTSSVPCGTWSAAPAAPEHDTRGTANKKRTTEADVVNGGRDVDAARVASEARIANADHQGTPFRPPQLHPGCCPTEPILPRQPESRPKSQAEWIVEINGINTALARCENECAKLDNAYALASKPLDNRQRRALRMRHFAVLNLHYDFLLVSQHPRAPPTVRNYPTRDAMHRGIWLRGIVSCLELMRHRLPGSLEHIRAFLYMTYGILSSLEEAVGSFEQTWIEWKAGLALYAMHLKNGEFDIAKNGQPWRGAACGAYARVVDKFPTCGSLYYKMGALEYRGPRSDIVIIRFFYCIFFPCCQQLLTIGDQISRSRQDSAIITAVAHLVLASLPSKASPGGERNTRRDTRREDHLQVCYKALKELVKIPGHPSSSAEECAINGVSPPSFEEIMLLAKLNASIRPGITHTANGAVKTADHMQRGLPEQHPGPAGQAAQTATLRPRSPSLMLLLGFPSDDKSRSPMMAAWAPDLVAQACRPNIAVRMAAGRVYEEPEPAALLLAATTTHILKKADTLDVRFWEIIHVMFVFMLAMTHRPDQFARFEWAFPTSLLVPFLNMALRETEARDHGWEKVSDMGFPTSPLDKEKNANGCGEYYTTPLPEDMALRGLFFASQAGARWTKGTSNDIGSDERLKSYIRDPDLFPAGWFEDSKYSPEEDNVRREYVQDEPTVFYRLVRIVWTTSRLMHASGRPGFFNLIDRDGRHHIVLPWATSAPRPRLDAKMPHVVERARPGAKQFRSDAEEPRAAKRPRPNTEDPQVAKRPRLEAEEAQVIERPHLDTSMPQVVERNKWLKVVYIDPSLPEHVANMDATWERAESEQSDELDLMVSGTSTTKEVTDAASIHEWLQSI